MRTNQIFAWFLRVFGLTTFGEAADFTMIFNDFMRTNRSWVAWILWLRLTISGLQLVKQVVPKYFPGVYSGQGASSTNIDRRHPRGLEYPVKSQEMTIPKSSGIRPMTRMGRTGSPGHPMNIQDSCGAHKSGKEGLTWFILVVGWGQHNKLYKLLF